MRVLLLYYSITVPASSSVIVISAMLIVASVFMLIGSFTIIFKYLICNGDRNCYIYWLWYKFAAYGNDLILKLIIAILLIIYVSGIFWFMDHEFFYCDRSWYCCSCSDQWCELLVLQHWLLYIVHCGGWFLIALCMLIVTVYCACGVFVLHFVTYI